MPEYGDRQPVGVPAGFQSVAGRPVYITPQDEYVSEKSVTIPIEGFWVNVPSIHDGYQYNEEELTKMLMSGLISPTSVHFNQKEALMAAMSRSPSLLAEQEDEYKNYGLLGE